MSGRMPHPKVETFIIRTGSSVARKPCAPAHFDLLRLKSSDLRNKMYVKSPKPLFPVLSERPCVGALGPTVP